MRQEHHILEHFPFPSSLQYHHATSTMANWNSYERSSIPSYEESIATSSHWPVPSSGEKSTAAASSAPSTLRQERDRRIKNLVTSSIIPCFSLHLSNACNKLIIVVIPSDGLHASQTVTEQNIVTPSLRQTTGSLLRLSGEANRSMFWTQESVVQELGATLRRELAASTLDDVVPHQHQHQHSPSLYHQNMHSASGSGPPGKRSWLKRTFVLPGPDHDPTGETGKWDLGWRSPECQAGTCDDGWMERPGEQKRTLTTDEVAVRTRLQDVSYRTENQMGLWETWTVKCIWIEIEVAV